MSDRGPGAGRGCPICGKPARIEENKTVVFHVAKWAEGLPHVGERLRCTNKPPHTWEVQSFSADLPGLPDVQWR